jgi:hypothetical protein
MLLDGDGDWNELKATSTALTASTG